MKKLTFLTVFILAAAIAIAQNKSSNSSTYKSAIGVKGFNGVGASFKTFLTQRSALEFVGFFRGQGARVGMMYELHNSLNKDGNLKFYYGPGIHVGFYKFDGLANDNGTYLGGSVVIGLDYKVKSAPVNIALDLQPAVEVFNGNTFLDLFGGLALRFTF